MVLVSLETFSCAPLEVETIETVKLSYVCMQSQVKGEEHNKSAILLVHGLGASLDSWKGVWELLALSTGRRVCSLDLRNHGNSPWSERADIPAMAADILAFLDARKIEKVNLVGHSLGGKVSVHFTLNNPNRVNSIVVEDMRPNGATPQAVAFFTTAMKLLQEGIKKVPEISNEEEARKIVVDFLNQKLKEFNLEEHINPTTARNLPIRCINGKCQFKMNIEALNKALEDPEKMLVESKGLYEGPALFIYGKKSIFDIPGDEENILKLFPYAKLIGVEGASHGIHGNFKQFDDEVLRFLKPLN